VCETFHLYKSQGAELSGTMSLADKAHKAAVRNTVVAVSALLQLPLPLLLLLRIPLYFTCLPIAASPTHCHIIAGVCSYGWFRNPPLFSRKSAPSSFCARVTRSNAGGPHLESWKQLVVPSPGFYSCYSCRSCYSSSRFVVLVHSEK
jgi:hypothetical protein